MNRVFAVNGRRTAGSVLRESLLENEGRLPTWLALIALCGGVVGMMFAGGISLMLVTYLGFTSEMWPAALGAYVTFALAPFHMAEFVVAALYRPREAGPEAFMLFHSPAYILAVALSLVEFALEVRFVPASWKYATMSNASIWLGVLGTVVWYGLRVVAMVQCGSNFSLNIEHEHREDHELCNEGVYRYLRHPSYTGWFWRTVCTQIILMNPVSFVVFTLVTWRFFVTRIAFEEALLAEEEFFGPSYTEYKKRTYTLIPFIA